MVAAHQVDRARIAHFHPKQQSEYFWLISPSINIVSQKDKFFPCFSKFDLSEYLHQIVVLSVNVANYHNFPINSQHIRFSLKYGFSFLANLHQDRFRDEAACILEIHNQFCVGRVGSFARLAFEGEDAVLREGFIWQSWAFQVREYTVFKWIGKKLLLQWMLALAGQLTG